MAVLPRRILAIDVGEQRIGLAIADTLIQLPSPLKTISNTTSVVKEISQLVKTELVEIVVIGLPRSLNGDETAQTSYVRQFTEKLKTQVAAKFYYEDEALSSVRAEEELKIKSKNYKKSDIDALAACYILDDFLVNHKEIVNV